MIDPSNVPPVSDDEELARYIFSSSHVRRADKSLKPDAFMPPMNLELSVTRHLATNEVELWGIGETVALASSRTLRGRADIDTKACLGQKLSVQAAPIIPQNPNHAHIVGWPADKPARKIVALEIAAKAKFIPKS
jgi:hypothetical protein